jgi:hypothetical protein
VSEAEDPDLVAADEVTVEDVRRLMGPSTPHFALQLRNRIAKLIAGLPPEHPARLEGEREIERLNKLGYTGEVRGDAEEGTETELLRPLPSLAEEPLPSLPDEG